MSPKYVLAVDAGTSGVRCLVADLNGRLVSLCRGEWTYETPDDIAPLGKEFDPNVFWDIICHTVSGAIRAANIKGSDIVGVSVTSQREGAIFLDKEEKELYAGPNIDLRALAEGISMDSEFGNEIYSITGHTPSFLFVSAKLKWFENNQPETYSRIATVLTIGDWITYRLCGERVGEACGASELGLIDVRRRCWSDKLRDLLHLPDGIYPKLSEAGSQVGKVSSQAAAETGIMEGTAVAVGAPDAQCGLIGLGIASSRQAGVVAGWSAPVQIVTDKPIFDPEAKTWTSCHALPRKWILESSAGEVGSAYRWLKDTMFDEQSDEEAYALMDSLAQRVAPGADGVLAFVGPAAMDMSHLGLKFGGFLFPVPFSVTNLQRAHLVRAVLENICFAIKANCLQLETISGMKIEEVRIGGSLAKSQCLVEILAAVLDSPVIVPKVTEVSGFGAAMCAAVGSGVYSSLEEAMTAMKPEVRVIEPDRLAVLEYDECYQRWTATADWLGKLSEETQ